MVAVPNVSDTSQYGPEDSGKGRGPPGWQAVLPGGRHAMTSLAASSQDALTGLQGLSAGSSFGWLENPWS